jgi:hypothetical protein
MECERVREEFIERLTGALTAERAVAIDQHLATCPACRSETGRMREMWTELGALRPPTPTAAGDRFGRLIEARGRTAPTTRRRAPQLMLGAIALAASLVVGVVLGRLSTGMHDDVSVAAAVSPAPKERYVLLLHGPARDADAVGEQAIVAEYRAWAMKLRASGSLVSAEKLAGSPVTMLAANTETELPHNAADELGGFFLIQVADSAEAFRIARECPHLKHGGTVQVRRIEPT